MNLEIENISENESTINFVFEKKDYIEELKNQIHFIKNNTNRNGFRGKNTPTDILFREAGVNILDKIITEKISNEFRKIQENNQKENNIIFDPILIESTLNTKKTIQNINEIGDINSKFIYCHTKKIDIETLKEILSNITINSHYCSDIDSENLVKIASETVLIHYIGKEKEKSTENSIIKMVDEDNQELFIPCICKINNDQINLKNKQINDTIELSFKENQIYFNERIFNLINYNYKVKKEKNSFKIVRIFTRINVDIQKIIDDTYYKFDIAKNNKNISWINGFLNTETSNYKPNIDTEYDKIIDFQKIRDISLYQCNLALEKITTLEVKNSILNNFNIDIENYASEKAKKIMNRYNADIKKTVETIIKNEIILKNIKNTIIKTYNITCTKEDIVNYINIYSTLINTEINSLITKYYGNKIKNKFILQKNSYEDIIIEQKAIYEIKKLINIENKQISYDTFININN